MFKVNTPQMSEASRKIRKVVEKEVPDILTTIESIIRGINGEIDLYMMDQFKIVLEQAPLKM